MSAVVPPTARFASRVRIQELLGQELLGQRLRDVALVTKELAKQAARELALLGVVADSPWADERPQLDRMATLPLGPLSVPPCPMSRRWWTLGPPRVWRRRP